MAASSDHEEIRSSRLEKLVIVAIVLVLSAITAVMMSRLENVERLARAREECKSWVSAIYSYRRKYGDYPSSLHALTQVQADGCVPFMEPSMLLDPWGHEYQYSRGVVFSLGPRPNDPNSIIGSWR